MGGRGEKGERRWEKKESTQRQRENHRTREIETERWRQRERQTESVGVWVHRDKMEFISLNKNAYPSQRAVGAVVVGTLDGAFVEVKYSQQVLGHRNFT